MRFVHKQLQTAFNTVTEQYELWKTTEASIQSCLKEIVCTAENLQHVQKVKSVLFVLSTMLGMFMKSI